MCEAEADAEHSYKMRRHRAIIVMSERTTSDGKKPTVAWIEAQAELQCEDEAATYRVTSAHLRALKESLNTKRAALDALRTLAANIRGQT